MIALSSFAPGFFELLVTIFVAAVLVLPFWKIFSKAGFSGALSLLVLVPLVNVVMIFFLAFAQWPALQASR